MMNDRSFPVLAAPAAALFIGSLRQIQGCSMRPRWFCVYVFLAAGLLVPFFGAGNAHAAVIANWDKSSRSWNNSHMTGNTLTVSAGNGIVAGSMIDNNYVRYEQIGNGYVVVFGDRIDHDDVISDTNTKLMLNLVSFAIVRTVQIPAASATGLVLTSLVLVGLGILQFARRRRCVY
jgi:hypothetical protein